MTLRTYALFVVFFCLLGLCTVHEATRQTRLRYRTAELLVIEERLGDEQARLESRLASLCHPAHLEKLNQEMRLGLVPLRPLGADGEAQAALPPGPR